MKLIPHRVYLCFLTPPTQYDAELMHSRTILLKKQPRVCGLNTLENIHDNTDERHINIFINVCIICYEINTKRCDMTCVILIFKISLNILYIYHYVSDKVSVFLFLTIATSMKRM